MPDGREVVGDGSQRGFEYDSITDQYASFLIEDVIPALREAGLAITDDPEYTKDIFSRLRPTALPGFGTLVEIRFDTEARPPRG